MSTDFFGFSKPVFYYQAPLNVRNFIRELRRLNRQHWFIFCSHGSIIGNTFASMADRLKEKGIIVVGYHHTYADATLPFYPHPTYTSGHPDSIDLEEAVVFGREAVLRSRKINWPPNCMNDIDTGLMWLRKEESSAGW